MILVTNIGVRIREFSLCELYDDITAMLEDGYDLDEMWVEVIEPMTIEGDD